MIKMILIKKANASIGQEYFGCFEREILAIETKIKIQ
jgi:hypothetical protein